MKFTLKTAIACLIIGGLLNLVISGRVMANLGWFLLGIVGLGMIFHLSGNPKFWGAVRKNPDLAWKFFSSRPEWHLRTKPATIEVDGPFNVVNPASGELVKAWCDTAQIDRSQKEFLSLLDATRM